MTKNRKIEVKGIVVTISERGKDDFISLTDVARGFQGSHSLIEKWIRNKGTIEFLAVWEQLNNQDFNKLQFEEIIREAGTGKFSMSAKQWIERTNAIGIFASAGRYGGTYATPEIAFEFCTWINPSFKAASIKKMMNGGNYNSIFDEIFDSTESYNDDSCCLYVMQDLSTMLYKIGISKHPEYRESTLQSQKPTINMIYSQRFAYRSVAYSIEQQMHEMFSNKRVRGEWFNLSSVELQQIRSIYFS